MPFATPRLLHTRGHIVVSIEIPEIGEISSTGRSENLVDPSQWHDVDVAGHLVRVKMVACKVLSRHRGVR